MRFCRFILAGWAVSSLAAEPSRQLTALKLEIVSIRDARTSTPTPFRGNPPTTEWTVITANANSREQFAEGDAIKAALFVGDVQCLVVVWRGLRVSCIAPRIADVGKRDIWGPVEVSIGRHELPSGVRERMRALAEKENRVFKLEGAAVRPSLKATDLNALIALIVDSSEI